MRRPVATTLVLVMLAAFLAPAAMATVTSPTPACCRAGGQHRCSATVAGGGAQFQGRSCPYRKPLVFSGSAAPQPASEVVAPADPHPFLHEFYPDLLLSHGEQPHPERAPPQLLLK